MSGNVQNISNMAINGTTDTCFETAHHIIGCQLHKLIDPN